MSGEEQVVDQQPLMDGEAFFQNAAANTNDPAKQQMYAATTLLIQESRAVMASANDLFNNDKLSESAKVEIDSHRFDYLGKLIRFCGSLGADVKKPGRPPKKAAKKDDVIVEHENGETAEPAKKPVKKAKDEVPATKKRKEKSESVMAGDDEEEPAPKPKKQKINDANDEKTLKKKKHVVVQKIVEDDNVEDSDDDDDDNDEFARLPTTLTKKPITRQQ